MRIANIPEYPNYQIYENGSVINIKTQKIIATQPNTRGYLTVNLWKNNKLKKMLVHRLVAENFIENPNNLPCVNHIDKNKQNNNVDNLEWCSYKENSQYSLREMRDAREALPHKIPVKTFRNGEWKIYKSISEASKDTGTSITTIRTSLRKTYKNPREIWEYVN